MKIALVAGLSQANYPYKNFEEIKRWAKEAKKQGAELLLFGEAFLQGFQAMTFQYQDDIEKCLSRGSKLLAEIRQFAKEEGIGIGFGYYENDKGAIYSSYLVIGESGEPLVNYKRVSQGWKEPSACADYREGEVFKSFRYKGKELGLMVCGDFWEDHLLAQIIEMDAHIDAFLWPVHCDYDPAFWEESSNVEYQKRTEILEKPVLFINNYSSLEDGAKGGLYLWHQGKTLKEVPMGQEAMLLVELT